MIFKREKQTIENLSAKDIYTIDEDTDEHYFSVSSLNKLRLNLTPEQRSSLTIDVIPEEYIYSEQDFYFGYDSPWLPLVVKMGNLLVISCLGNNPLLVASAYLLDKSNKKHTLLLNINNDTHDSFVFCDLFGFDPSQQPVSEVYNNCEPFRSQKIMASKLAKKVKPFFVKLAFGEEINMHDFQSALTTLIDFTQGNKSINLSSGKVVAADAFLINADEIKAHLELWKKIGLVFDELFNLPRSSKVGKNEAQVLEDKQKKRALESKLEEIKTVLTSLAINIFEAENVVQKQHYFRLFESSYSETLSNADRLEFPPQVKKCLCDIRDCMHSLYQFLFEISDSTEDLKSLRVAYKNTFFSPGDAEGYIRVEDQQSPPLSSHETSHTDSIKKSS